MKDKLKAIGPYVGLVVLLLLVGASVYVFLNSKNIFKSRASDPDPAPQNVVLSNVSEQGFTISYLTPQANSGTVVYGTDPLSLTQTAVDIQGTSVSARIHYINVATDLTKKTYYKIRCGSCNSPNDYGIVPGQSIGPGNIFILDSLTAGGGALDITAPAIAVVPGRNPTPIFGSLSGNGSPSVVYSFYSLSGSRTMSAMLSTFTKNRNFSLEAYNTRTADYLNYMGLPVSGSNLQLKGYSDTPSGFVSANFAVSVLSSSTFQPLTDVLMSAYSLPTLATAPPPSSTSSATFDFTLTNGGDKTASVGSSVTNIINATLASGSAQPVVFSVSGLPSGSTSSFNPTSCNPTCSTTLTVVTGASTSAGLNTVTVTGISGTLSKNTSFILNVTAPLACSPDGTTCKTGSTCCSGVCVLNTCATPVGTP